MALLARVFDTRAMVTAPGMCSMWHRDPRPMLRPATLDEAGPQRSTRRMVEVLCDDGRWHTGRLEAWHQGVRGLECLISWRGAPVREYSGWYGYSPTALRPRPEETDNARQQSDA